jgi:hypothetical protein
MCHWLVARSPGRLGCPRRLVVAVACRFHSACRPVSQIWFAGGKYLSNVVGQSAKLPDLTFNAAACLVTLLFSCILLQRSDLALQQVLQIASPPGQVSELPFKPVARSDRLNPLCLGILQSAPKLLQLRLVPHGGSLMLGTHVTKPLARAPQV